MSSTSPSKRDRDDDYDNSSLTPLNRFQKILNAYKHERDLLSEQYDSVNEALRSVTEEKNQLSKAQQSKVDEARAEKLKSEVMAREIDRLKASLTSKMEEIETLDLVSVDQLQSSLHEALAHILDLEHVLDAKDGEIVTLRRERNEFEEKISTMLNNVKGRDSDFQGKWHIFEELASINVSLQADLLSLGASSIGFMCLP